MERYHLSKCILYSECVHESAAYANDASFNSAYSNNTIFETVWDEKYGTKRVFLKAISNIEKGEEIFVDYGRDYWKDFMYYSDSD